ncbi:MAG TPA: alpha/beta fold hydrolase [Thermoanaerobaculia bacterium]|nr:alpha/beta fold hydrolase [Thermoanaerobaculia bacterium]
MAETPEEDQRRRRRNRLVRGLLVGGAALGLPALVNAVVAQRARRLSPQRWGQPQRFRWRDCQISYRRVGARGPLVVLLHSIGPGHSSLEWREVTERLGTRHRIWAPDLLGWGDSDRPRLRYDSHLYLDLLADFLHEAVGEPCTLVAAGLSGAYAAQVAVDHPELVRALALSVPLGVDLHGDEPDLKDTVLHRMLRLPIVGTSALNAFTSHAALGHHLRREVFADPKRVGPALLEEHYRSSHLPGAHGPIAAYVSGFLNHSVSAILQRVEQPVWLGWGRAAKSPGVEAADLWLRQLRAAEIEVFEDAALLPHLERPADVARSLADFLARQGR